MYILSVLIGLVSGLVAVVLKNAVHLVEYLLKTGVSHVHDYLYFIYPAVGIFLVVLIAKWVIREKVGHGIPIMLYAISKGNGNIGKKDTWASVISAAITVGFGGSVGLEGPTVATAGALSSNIGQLLRLDYKNKKLLIGAAASGALAAIFNAPIAAIVFALEVIMLDLTITSLIPLLLSSATAAVMSRLLFSNDYLFHFSVIDDFHVKDIFFYVMLGLFTGLLSVQFTNTYFLTDKWLKKIKNVYLRPIIGGVAVGAMIFVFPQLYGEGYGTINALIADEPGRALSAFNLIDISDQAILGFVLLFTLPILKSFAASLTLNSGGVGGIFAPTLFIGSTGGYMFGQILTSLGFDNVSRSNFTLVGMAGAMAGILQAPLTAIFLIAEITGGYTLFLPLMVTAVISFLFVRYFTPYSVYTKQLGQGGQLITHHKDRAVLTLMRLKNEIETNFSTIHAYDKLGDLVKVVSLSSRNLFPVIDEQNVFLGVVNLNDVREIMFDRDKYDELYVHELMTPAPEFIYVSDTMEQVMLKFDQSGAWNLPVVSDDSKYIGFVSKSKLFSAYRKLLRDFYEEGD
ncbi:MAG: CIC family chloride channel protein [Salibacteraceae bacterium]|jgi:CIC family chloride channel protein